MEHRISPKPHVSSGSSLGDLCQAMFIEGARVLGYAEEALMPTEVLEQVFLAAAFIADGLARLLQVQESGSCSP